MAVSGSEPISSENLRSLVRSGALGNPVVLLDDQSLDVKTGTIQLSQSVEGLLAVDVVLSPGVYAESRIPTTSVRLPHPDGRTFYVAVYKRNIAYEAVTVQVGFSGSTMTVSGEEVAIMQVVGYR